MKKITLLTAMIIAVAFVNAQSGKDTTINGKKGPAVETAKASIDTAFTIYMDAVYKQFAKQFSDRLSTTQWKSVLGELNQALYDATIKDLNSLLISAIEEWNKRKAKQ